MQRRGNRRDRRLADMAITPDDGPRFVPFRDGATANERTFDLMHPFRLFQGQWYDERGQLTDFCYILSIETTEGWREAVRIDCCHGEAHVHRFDADGGSSRRVIRKIDRQDDVNDACRRAEGMIYDQLEQVLLLWERGQ